MSDIKVVDYIRAKTIPSEQMEEKPECTMMHCKAIAHWNINNISFLLCHKHFKKLAETGQPILIVSKSILKM